MTEPARKKNARTSHPRISALGWEELEPTRLIDKSLEKLREAVRTTKDLQMPALPREPKEA